MTDGLQARRRWLHAAAAGAATAALGPLARPARAAGDDIVIGQSAHLSGPLAATLAAVLRGQQLAVEEFNRKGGVGGRQVRLVTLDDAYDPARCLDNVRRLIDQEHATALFGLASTANVAAVLPLLEDRKVPLVGVYTGAPSLRQKPHPTFFTAMASYADEVVAIVRNLVTVGRTRIALAYHDSPFGQQMLPVVEAACRQLGATLVAKAALDIPGQHSVAVCQSLAQGAPQAVIFMAFGPALVPFVRAARTHISAQVYGPSIANSGQLLKALGDDARGLSFAQTVPYPMQATTAVTRDYHAVMQRARLPVDFDHFFGYLNLRVLLEGLRRAGRQVSPQSLVTALEAAGRIDLGGYAVTYGPGQHHGSSFVDLLIVGPGGRFIR
ncbi:ABC transporter substrate-binding protein [Ideonella sp.]|uniref:ABC transporter substrate-binding protein n=1 Tax=Ideonella sp. TaxID=1929293 RepID=UPI0035ADEF78